MRVSTIARLSVILVALLGLLGCRLPTMLSVGPQGSGAATVTGDLPFNPAPFLVGRADFAGGRSPQATLNDVGTKGTVSLIHTGNNQTVSTTVTDAAGGFSLKFSAGFKADPTVTYYLEAVKGLGNNQPYLSAARIRTVVKFDAPNNRWVSFSNADASASVVLNVPTTALAVGGALKGVADFSPYLNALPNGDPTSYAGTAAISSADLTTLRNYVQGILTDDEDPVAHIALAPPSAWLRIGQKLNVAAITPNSGTTGTTVTFTGGGFVADATVTFNGGATTVVTPQNVNTLAVTVPVGAVSGQTTVQVANLSVLAPIFTVPVTVGSFTPTSGGSGATVTVSGTGFSTVLANNLVTVGGVSATVLSATATSLTIRTPSANSGPIAVTVLGQTGTSVGTYTYQAALHALTPSFGVTNDVLTLEGSFGPTVTVNFPGGSAVAATKLGPNRAKVSIPSGATTGSLTVTTAGITTNALPFRRASYSLGMQPVAAYDDQADYPRLRPTLSTARRHSSSAVIGNYLYVIGGENGAYLNTVERAPINADGTLGVFGTVATMTAARSGHTSAVIGNYLYVMGGYNGSHLNTVERAPINADGTIGAFSAVGGVTLGQGRREHTCAVVGNYLYVLGGYNGGYLNTVERAEINPDATLQPFSAVSGFAYARSGHTTAVVGNYLYVMGGYNGSYLSNVERATIDASSGMLGDFSTVSGVSLSSTRRHASLAVIGSYLYVVGGDNGANMNTVVRALIGTNGAIGNFASVANITLGTARSGHGCAVIGNHLYVFGGHNGTSHLNTIERVALGSGSSLGNFSAVAGSTLATARSGHAGAVVRSYLYAVGGKSGASYLNSVERASLAVDGTPGAFSTVGGVTLVTARSGHALAVSGNYLYVIGGTNGGYLNTVERAAINADGTLGAFATVGGVTLATARAGHTVSIHGGYLYVTGGSNGAFLNTVERSAIAADGSLGAFSAVGGVTLAQARTGHTSVVTGSYLYLVGGQTSVQGVFPDDGFLRSTQLTAGNLVVGPDNPTRTGKYYVDYELTGFAVGTTHVLNMRGSFDTYLQLINKGTGAVITQDDDGGIGSQSRISFTVAAGITYVARATSFGNSVTGAISVSADLDDTLVERAAIASDGTIGTFSTVTDMTLVANRYGHAGAVSGSYLYVSGGTSNGSAVATVERASIASDGTLGSFSTVGGVNLATARTAHSSAVIGNYLYAIGGNNGSEVSSVDRALLQ